MDALSKKDKNVIIVFAVVGIIAWSIIGVRKLINDQPLPSEKLKIIEGDTPELISKANTVLPTVLAACPGLQQSASEFDFIRAEAATLLGFRDGVAIHFLVKNPNGLPDSIRRYSAGHNCWISINQANRIDVSKRACQSVCLGKKVN